MQRLICLDGLRGLLALYVAVSHMAPFAPLPSALAGLLSHGGAAVDVFFVLSGLVIVRSLAGFRWQARPFLITRVCRIFPAYLVMLAVAVAVQPLPSGFDAMPWIGLDSQARAIWSDGWPDTWAAELLAHLTMLHGLVPPAVLPDAWVSFLGAAWSLSTEWQFYLLVLLLGRLDRRAHRLDRLVAWFLLLAAAGQLGHAVMPPDWRFSRAFLPNKAQYFALGIASARLLAEGGTARYLATLGATLALSGWSGGVDKLFAPLVWTLCLAAQRHPNHRALGWLARLLRAPALVGLGALSYCLYLANEPVQKPLGIALAWYAGGHGVRFALLWVPLSLLLPLLVAAGLHRMVEMPMLRWSRSLVRPTADAASPAPAPPGPLSRVA